MKKFLLSALIVIVVAIGSFIVYLKFILPEVSAAEELSVELTPERIAHGKYLAHSVTVCMDCHSQRDWSQFSGPIVPGTEGQGGEVFNQDFGFPGNYVAKNITPYGVGDWTDGELMRAITCGVNRDGKALFPIMPYPGYGKLAKEDIMDVIAYIRSLDPIEKDIEASVSDFPMSLIINTIPKDAKFSEKPDQSDELAYGHYMFTASGCSECHTPAEKGQAIEGMYLAGGFNFELPWGLVRSSNITQDKETGIGNWTWDQFRDRFKQYQDSGYVSPVIKGNDFNTVMPWVMYSSMKEEDLRAIYTYLKTVEPISNNVVKFEPN